MRHVAAGSANGPRHEHVSRHFAALSVEVPQHTTGMGMFDAAAEQQRRKKPVAISYIELAESVGVSKSSAQSAVAWLMRRKLISSKKASVTATPNYSVHTPWRPEHRRSASNAAI